MLRLALVSFSLLALVGVTACIEPELPDLTEEPDAAPPPPPPDAALDCEPREFQVGTGHHNPGLACLECHNGQDPAAPIYTLAGTVFQDLQGTIPKVGATVIIIDGDGTVVKVPTQQNGNFYTPAGLTPPFNTAVSQCGAPIENLPMITNFVDGDCNSCHSGPATEPGYVVFD
jgi:hypothetical protein